MLDPDPESTNPDPKHWKKVFNFLSYLFSSVPDEKFYLFCIWNIIFILFITLSEDYLGYTIKTFGNEKSGRPGDESSRIHKSGVEKGPDTKSPDFYVWTVFLQFKLLKMFSEHVLDSCNKYMQSFKDLLF